VPKNLSAWLDFCIFLAVFGIFVLVLMSYNIWLSAIAGVTWLCLLMFARERCRSRKLQFERYCRGVVENINELSNHAINRLPQAILIVDHEGHLEWSNEALQDYLGQPLDRGELLADFWPELVLQPLWGKKGETVCRHDGKSYQVLYRPIETEEPEGLMALYISDTTEKEELKKNYYESRVVLAYIQVDNYAEVIKGLSEVERTALLFEVNDKLNRWMSSEGGYLRRVSEELYVAVLERRNLDSIEQQKFGILDTVNGVHGSNKIPVTLSVGVAVAEHQSATELGDQAQACLDLALGRGGGQAVILESGNRRFYGGKSEAAEKQTRVQARVISHALRQFVDECDEVLVMGHHNEDFDALGAALGVAHLAREAGKPVHVVLSRLNEGIDKFLEELKADEEFAGLFVRETELNFLDTLPINRLVVVVDTHIRHLVAAPVVLDHASGVVVIDHHRRSETPIQGAQLFYCEPSASSASELVAELIQYFNDGKGKEVKLNSLEATGLYSGILVDTKNFSVQANARTFDAASYLRRAGADPVVVRRIFKMDYETSMVVARAKADSEYFEGGLIVTVCPKCTNVQAVAAQTADSLLRIEGVNMSMVIYQMSEDVVGISARAAGHLNVQVIMEEFGGGGHQNVAGAQIKGETLEAVKAKVVELSRKYIEENG